MKYELELPYAPPSQNKRRGEHWGTTRRRKAQIEGDLMKLLLLQRVPRLNGLKVHATAVVRLPKNRRRDEGNYRDVLEKALGDTLQLHGLDDDTPDYFTFGEITFDQGQAQTTITLEVE